MSERLAVSLPAGPPLQELPLHRSPGIKGSSATSLLRAGRGPRLFPSSVHQPAIRHFPLPSAQRWISPRLSQKVFLPTRDGQSSKELDRCCLSMDPPESPPRCAEGAFAPRTVPYVTPCRSWVQMRPQCCASLGVTAQSQGQPWVEPGVPPPSTNGFRGNQCVLGKERFSAIS